MDQKTGWRHIKNCLESQQHVKLTKLPRDWGGDVHLSFTAGCPSSAPSTHYWRSDQRILRSGWWGHCKTLLSAPGLYSPNSRITSLPHCDNQCHYQMLPEKSPVENHWFTVRNVNCQESQMLSLLSLQGNDTQLDYNRRLLGKQAVRTKADWGGEPSINIYINIYIVYKYT